MLAAVIPGRRGARAKERAPRKQADLIRGTRSAKGLFALTPPPMALVCTRTRMTSSSSRSRTFTHC
eukprot:482457-Prorocentrum_lima.AAC.1